MYCTLYCPLCVDKQSSKYQMSEELYSLLFILMYIIDVSPVKNVTGIFSCLFDGSLVWFENETKSDGNPIIFLANAMENP